MNVDSAISNQLCPLANYISYNFLSHRRRRSSKNLDEKPIVETTQETITNEAEVSHNDPDPDVVIDTKTSNVAFKKIKEMYVSCIM